MKKNKMKTGVCSISFRELGLSDLVDLVAKAGLDAIEWGGDVHVPHGSVEVAKEALALTRAAGLEACSYGSYYKVLDPDGVALDFTPVLQSTLALETDVVRIWAGQKASADAADDYRKRVVDQIRKVAEVGAAEDVKVALEFHAFTLTDSNESAMQLLDEVGHENLYMYWQPIFWTDDMAYRLDGLRKMRDRILNLHVFNWGFDPTAGGIYQGIIRKPIPDAAAEWAQYLAVELKEELPHYALIEHPSGSSPEQLMKDAAALKTWTV